MSELSVFSFKGAHGVRVQTISGEPWFCLKDICEVLSIDRASDLVRVAKGDGFKPTPLARGALDPKGVANCHTLTMGGKQKLQFVNEPNLYRVIFRSNKPEARQFQDWVFNEVLPAIRKTGSYRHAAVALVQSREPLTGEQKRELVLIIGQIANQFHFKRAWVSGIWQALRRTTGNQSPAPMTTDDLPAIQRELRRIIAVAEQTKSVTDAIERDVIRLAIRGRQPAISVFGKAGQYGRENFFTAELPAKLEIMVEHLCLPANLLTKSDK